MVVSPEGVETFIMTEAGMERAEQGFSHSVSGIMVVVMVAFYQRLHAGC